MPLSLRTYNLNSYHSTVFTIIDNPIKLSLKNKICVYGKAWYRVFCDNYHKTLKNIILWHVLECIIPLMR